VGVSGTACLSRSIVGDATPPQNRRRSRTAKPCPLHAGLGPTTAWPSHNRRPPLPQSAFASEGRFAQRSRPSPRRRNASERTFRTHGCLARNATPPSEVCFQFSPNCRPSQALFACPMAVGRPARTILESSAPLPPAPSSGISPPPQRRHPPSPLQAASALNALTVHALWPFRRQRPLAPEPPRSKRFFARCADLTWKCAFTSTRPPAHPTCRRPFRAFAFPRGRLRPKPTPPQPAFTRHNFRFHHHRPNVGVSGTACLSSNLAGESFLA